MSSHDPRQLRQDEQSAQRARWDAIAPTYGEVLGSGSATDAAASLAELAGTDGRALELGAGIGRIAFPLAGSIRRVDALDLSLPMLERLLAAAPPNVSALLGTMDAIPVLDRTYNLIYSINSSFYYLLSQDAQIECLRETWRCLRPGGLMVLECFNPLTSSLMGNPHTHPRKAIALRELREDLISLSISRTDFTSQQTLSQEVTMTEGRTSFQPLVNRFCWPSELDLMARIAGLDVLNRTSDWSRQRDYDADRDFNHVTVLRRPA